MQTPSSINKLGESLRKLGPTPENLNALAEFRRGFQDIDTRIEGRLMEISPPVGSILAGRLKSTRSILEKLERDKSRLSKMRDIVGWRFEVRGGLAEQDNVVAQVLGIWPGAPVIDRRADPRHGYRAVHVEVEVDQRFAEIQVRSTIQQSWAVLVELISERFSRGIKYGQDIVVDGQPSGIFPLLLELSDIGARLEKRDATGDLEGTAKLEDSYRTLEGRIMELSKALKVR